MSFKPNVAFNGYLTGVVLEYRVQSQQCCEPADTPACVLASLIVHNKHQNQRLQHRHCL